MKKILTVVLAASLLAAPAANGQAFLNKLKEKAVNAVGNAISEKVNEKVDEKMDEVNEKVNKKVNDKIAEKTGVDFNAMEQQGQQGLTVVRSDQQLERRRASGFGWDGKITPSESKFPVPLMNEFPAVPSAQELANPTEAGMIAYYQAIKRVTLRAEELNADTTCEDNFAQEWRRKQEDKLAAAYGLTRAEWDAYNSGTLSDAEKEAVEKKMLNAMFGGVDLEKAAADAEAQMKQYENMSEEEMALQMQNNAINAMMQVYNENPGETKYVTGMTPAELQKALEAEMEYQAQQLAKGDQSGKPGPVAQKMQEYEKKMTAQDGAAYTKREKALQDKVQAASMKAARSAMGGFGALADAFSNAENFQKKAGISDALANEVKFAEAVKPMFAALNSDSNSDAAFSAAEKKKVESIKAKIMASNDPSEYNALYAQALDAIKTYRLRAAESWRASVQARFDKVKAEMPGYIKVMREEVEAGYIPECALWRAPLNVVIEAGDILEEAYSEFPCDYPSMFQEEVEREIKLKENESLWWPEFFVGMSVDDLVAGKCLYKSQNTSDGYQIYQFNLGKWNPVDSNFDEKAIKDVQEPASVVWKSADGKREVVYNAEGHWLQLPEGDIVNPLAVEKIGNSVVWVNYNEVQNQDGTSKVQIVKCTYKL